MEVKVQLTTEEVKQAIKNYVNTQGMSLSVKEIQFGDRGEATVTCEKAKHPTGFGAYDR
jgi:hypothetical protein